MGQLRGDFFTLSLPDEPLTVSAEGKDYVIDGDTIVIGGERWRLDGYDAPPISGNCCLEERERGKAAKAYLEQLIRWAAQSGALHIEVRKRREKYNRPLITIKIDGENVGEIMRFHGLADYYNGKGPKPVFCGCEAKSQLVTAQSAVREAKRTTAKLRKA